MVYLLCRDKLWWTSVELAPPPRERQEFEQQWFRREQFLTDREIAVLSNRFRIALALDPITIDVFFLFNEFPIISGRFGDCIEALEPGTHQLVPFVPVEPPEIKGLGPDRRYFLLNSKKRIDFLDIERSKLRKVVKSALSYTSGLEAPDLVAKPGWAPRGHLWRSTMNAEPRRLFLSSELRDAVVAGGVPEALFKKVSLQPV